MDQPITTYVRNNLLLELYFKAEIIYSPDSEGIQKKIQSKLENNTDLYFHGSGGSTPLGILGFVNAVLELKDQINKGEAPEPDYIYTACGSMGTTAGLALGVKLAGLKTIIYGIKVSNSPNIDAIIRLANKGWKLLVKNDKKIPKITYEHLQLDGRYFGDGYGKPTKECLEAVKLLKEKESVILEPTYTGKTMAGLIGNAQKDKLKLKDKTILFWNTYNSRDYSEILKTMDYHDLPKELHWVFEEPKPV
jgi:D-cysteine desulfhydrase